MNPVRWELRFIDIYRPYKKGDKSENISLLLVKQPPNEIPDKEPTYYYIP